jgi:tRNA(Ile)-lysidine synthase
MESHDFLLRLQNFIARETLFSKEDRLLVALSGGVDSVVLTDALHRLGYKIGIAHCNFQLRENESDADEQFVKTLAQQKNIPFHCKKFETSIIAKETKESIQVTARSLRYEWFESMLSEGTYHYVLTAHHQNDSTETILLNLVRGTGLSGLHGILPKRGNIIRPLLFATREDVEIYAREYGLQWREDKSNASAKYTRNLLRLQVIPLLKQINPHLDKAFAQTAQHILESERLLYAVLDQKSKKTCQRNRSNLLCINIGFVVSDTSPHLLLHHILSNYGFDHAVISQILDSQNSISGKLFFSKSHRLLRDRSHWILDTITPLVLSSIKIEKEASVANINDILAVRTEISSDKTATANALNLDLNKLVFPITVRPWSKGDTFNPSGMKGTKKVSDFLVDQKMNLFEKERTMVVESEGKIVGILNHRASDSHCVTEQSKKTFRMQLINL